jgi:SNF2 family DNA or RNA helicase
MPNYKYLTTPRAYQEGATLKIYPLEYSTLFMEQGTGKTKTYIDTASNWYLENLIDAVLVVCPVNIIDQWAEEQLGEHSPIGYTTFQWYNNEIRKRIKEYATFAKAKRDDVKALKWLVVPFDAFSYDVELHLIEKFMRLNRTAICVDEGTRIKNPTSERTINLRQRLADVVKEGKRIVSLTPLSVKRTLLTGTLVTENPFDLYSFFEWLKPDFWAPYGVHTYAAFKCRYGLMRRDVQPGTRRIFFRELSKKEIKRIRAEIQKTTPYELIAARNECGLADVEYIAKHPELSAPYKNLAELKSIIQPYSVILRKSDCLDLPPKTYEIRYVEMTAEQKRAYKELKRDLYVEFGERSLTVDSALVLATRLAQIAGGFFPHNEAGNGKVPVQISPRLPKIEELLDFTEETAEFPIIITAKFRAEVNAIYNAFTTRRKDLTVAMMHGGLDKDLSKETIRLFKLKEIDILIATPESICEGLNFQVSGTIVRYSNTFSLYVNEQLEDRIHRDGNQHTKILYVDIVCKDSVDEKNRQALMEKRDLLEYMRDTGVNEFLK